MPILILPLTTILDIIYTSQDCILLFSDYIIPFQDGGTSILDS